MDTVMRCVWPLLRSIRLALAAPACLALGSCGGGSDKVVPVAVIGALQPGGAAVQRSAPGLMVRAATAEGLVAFDEQGNIVPALADRWIVTDDGQSFIFRLRDGSWADGTKITGESAATALRQALVAVRQTPLGLDLAAIAEVRMMAGRVIELRLSRPEPDLLQLLAQPEMALTRNGRGTGPMRPRWTNGWVSLQPIPPEDLGLPQDEDWADRARNIELHGFSAQNAVARFEEGSMALVLGGTLADFPVIAKAGVGQGPIRFDKVSGLFGLAVQSGEGFLGDPANREAIAMAIDRDGLIAAFGLGGWTASTRLLPPGLEDDSGTVGERWAGQDIAARQATAAARVAAWRGKNGKPVSLRLAMPGGAGGEVLFAQLSRDLSNIGISLRAVGADAPADLRLIEEVARINRASWYFNQLACAARRTICSVSGDALAERARSESDPAKHAALVADAEVDLTRANVFIPFGAPIRWSLVSGGVTGFAINRWGVHPLMPLAMRPK